MIQGWVRDTSRRAPCHVHVLMGGERIAQAVANRFRGDLLRAGFGHGHYGFHARLTRYPARGTAHMLLHLPHLGASAPMRLEVPELGAPDRRTVEELLVDPPGWLAADVLACPGCLDMKAAHAAMGTPRFIDAVYRFVFGRWPSLAETRVNADGSRRRACWRNVLGHASGGTWTRASPRPLAGHFRFRCRLTLRGGPDRRRAMVIAETLVRELMLVSVLVAGEGAEALAAAMGAAGAEAEVLGPVAPQAGFDLAILLAEPGAAQDGRTRQLVDALSSASDRLLLAPLPLGGGAQAGAPALPALEQWFELFAELGYQPVVDFDAGFVAAGAFLVDRAATAAEGDLAAFADRLQTGGERVAGAGQAGTGADAAGTEEVEAMRATLASSVAELAAARGELSVAASDLTASRAELARCRADLAEADGRAAALAAQGQRDAAALQEMSGHNVGWDALRAWVRLDVTSLSRNTRAVLARDLPALNALRAPELPAVTLPPVEASSWLGRVLRRPIRSARHAALEDAARVRVSEQFDAAWYVASHPEDFAERALDPALHYVLVGGPRGADPGPHFDTQAYVRAHPEATSCPLAHALRARTG